MFDVIVVTSKQRKPLMPEYLRNEGVPHQISISDDENLPRGWEPEQVGLVHNQLGAYRCFKGHQKALHLSLYSENEYVVIFEDDCVPKDENWLSVLEEAQPLAKQFEVVSFHGRQWNKEAYQPISEYPKYCQPNDSCVPWIVAALAYMVPKRIVPLILSYKYVGEPYDLLLYRHFKYCLLIDSVFIHDRKEGTLIEP